MMTHATPKAGYAIAGPRHRVYFSGDTGVFPAMDTSGARLGPFDVTLIESGQHDGTWPDWHIAPEQAVRGRRMVGGRWKTAAERPIVSSQVNGRATVVR
jgi:L-ascorbate metabolism protein UlaG (beta-lactamase superfamily)